MSKKLKQLFDYQRFEENKELQQVIDSVHARYARRELSLEDMEMVAAAGTPELPEKPREKDQ